MISKEELALVFDKLAVDLGLNGAVLVSQDGEVLFEKAYGFASMQLSVPNVLETKFHIASMTKMFIAMAALILSEQGRLDLQARPSVYLPEMAERDKDLTIHHLLSQTSGIEDIYEVPNLPFEMDKLKLAQGDLLSYLVKLPQIFPPGERWSYSSTNYILIGYLLERVTGLSFDDLMKQYVLKPLSMLNTGLDVPRRINPGRAYGHTMEDSQLINARNDDLSAFEGPGEFYSTVQDMQKWCDAMFDCPLVSPDTLKLMLTPYSVVDWSPSVGYGYGWFLNPDFRWHGGGTPGFVSRIRQYPEQKISVVMLFNSDHASMEPIFAALEPFIAA